MQNFRKFALSFLAVLFFGVASAQEDQAYNSQSLRAVKVADQLYKRTLWWRMDLREKPNRPFAAANNEIAKIIIDAVKAGIIRPFKNDSLTERMDYDVFVQKLRLPSTGSDVIADDWDKEEEDTWEEEDTATLVPTNEEVVAEYFSKEFVVLEIKEDVIFDKRRGKMVHDIQSITLKLPINPVTGLEEDLACFSYKELVENVFRENPHANWYNPENSSENRNYMEAFEGRLFTAHLFKVANWDDLQIEDVYGAGKNAVVKAQQIEYELADFEQDSWEN